ncbi:MAG: transporter substrate-binding domain-containing protein [Acidobacteriia bacterium]|nr:transporter substrate-binding domain-containing protein [Terriglobia bacterium]
MSSTRPKRLKWIFPLSLVLALTAALGWLSTRQPKPGQQIYRIGFENEPPLHFVGKDGQATGLAVDMVAEAASRRGIRLHWQLEPEGSEAALTAKKVDLWPMMTIRPPRKGVLYITAPYREAEICLLVRSESSYTRLEDLGNSTISYNGAPLDLSSLRPRLPNARLVVIESPKDSLEAVCQQRIDATYLSEYTAVATLLAGVTCGGQGLRVIQVPELNGVLGVGATFEARPAADAIRQEIGMMAADGALTRIAARWRSFSGRNLELAEALIRAQHTERRLIAAIAGAVLLLFGTFWQAMRIRQQRNIAKQASTQLRQLAANLQNVREEERTRMARDLHDELGQCLTAIKMDIGWAAGRGLPDDKIFAERLQSTLALVDATIRTVRKLATELRPSTLDLGLKAAMEWQLEEFHTRTGIEYSLDLPHQDVQTDTQRSTALFRILQEALTNITRHADANRVDVRLELSHGDLTLEVHDNGTGIPEEQSPGRTFGIIGMQERALALGGEVTVKPHPSGGTVVRARIPFSQTNASGPGNERNGTVRP